MNEHLIVSQLCHYLGWPEPVREAESDEPDAVYWYRATISDSSYFFQVNVHPRFAACVYVEEHGIRAGFYRVLLLDDGSDVLQVARRYAPVFHRQWFESPGAREAHLLLFPSHAVTGRWPGSYDAIDPTPIPAYLL